MSWYGLAPRAVEVDRHRSRRFRSLSPSSKDFRAEPLNPLHSPQALLFPRSLSLAKSEPISAPEKRCNRQPAPSRGDGQGQGSIGSPFAGIRRLENVVRESANPTDWD